MTITETKTVAKLYETNSDIRRLIDFWGQERRCPMGLVDELLSEGMEDAADCALWAAVRKSKPVYFPCVGEEVGKCGPYPSKGHRLTFNGEYDWYWKIEEKEKWMKWASSIHRERLKIKIKYDVAGESETPTLAIIWLLDNWRRK